MEPIPVPIVEINPADPADVSMAFVPLSDLDDFLEDVSGDYELGFGELGAVKASASVKTKGKLAIKLPAAKAVVKVKPAAVKAAVKAAVRTKIPAVKAALKLAAKAKPGKVKAVLRAKLPAVKAAVKAKVKSAAAKVRAVTKSANKAPGKVAAKIAAKARKVVSVKPGKAAPVPLNRKALVHKAIAKKTAAKVVALAPHPKHMRPAARAKVAAALKGAPVRPKGLHKPAKAAVKAIRGSGVRCCIIARAKSGGGKTGALQARYKQNKKAKRSGPMRPLRFRATVQGLLTQIERYDPSRETSDKIARIRRITGVAV